MAEVLNIKTAPKASAPKRSHKSKKEQKRTPKVKMYGSFMERSKKPAVTGDTLKSVMLRVDAGFAEQLRGLAKRHGKSMTDITRDLAMSGAIANG